MKRLTRWLLLWLGVSLGVSSAAVAASYQYRVYLTGARSVAGATLSVVPSTHAFPDTVEGQASAGHTYTVTNVGIAAATVSAVTGYGPFNVVENCAGTLAVGASCQVVLTFVPGVAGTASGGFVVASSASNAAVSATASGRATATGSGFTYNPGALSFGDVNVGSTSTPQTLTITNASGSVQTVIGFALNPSGGYGLTADTCTGASLAAGGACSIAVAFAPTAAGSFSDRRLVVTSTTPTSPQQVTLAGTGIAVPGIAFSPSGSLTFAATAVGLSSPDVNLVVSNPGSATTVISGVAVSGPWTGGHNCGSLAPGNSCTIALAFRPVAAGAASGSVQVTSNASGSPHTVSLGGTGL